MIEIRRDILLKKRIAVILIVFGLSACSNSTEDVHQQNEKIEKELETAYKIIDEKGNEIEKYKRLVAESESNKFPEEYIVLHKNEAPKLWSSHDVQLWEYLLDFSMSKENGWLRGTTNWKELEENINPLFKTLNKAWEMPGPLMNAWLSEIQDSYWLGYDVWEITQRIKEIDEYTVEGYILSYGFKDDAISGSDLKIKMKKEEGYWYIDHIKVRYHCSRNVTKDKDLCV